MLTSKFIEKMNEMDFSVVQKKNEKQNKLELLVLNKDQVVATVNVLKEDETNTDFDAFDELTTSAQGNLLNVLIVYGETPVKDRVSIFNVK